ncbi:MAG: hypothetical protein IKH26_06880 [Bacteroidaceae bacterium]|nr:hypothetical protein [Bacteroidaceae bacterium]
MKKLVLFFVLSWAVLSVSAQGNGVFRFKGKIGNYPIVMELNATAASAWGDYYYVSQGSKNKLQLNGDRDLSDESGLKWVLEETVDDKLNGYFFLRWDRLSEYSKDGSMRITGTYINVKNKKYTVELKCDKADHYHGGYGK